MLRRPVKTRISASGLCTAMPATNWGNRVVFGQEEECRDSRRTTNVYVCLLAAASATERGAPTRRSCGTTASYSGLQVDSWQHDPVS